jgi:hypothetical protein
VKAWTLLLILLLMPAAANGGIDANCATTRVLDASGERQDEMMPEPQPRTTYAGRSEERTIFRTPAQREAGQDGILLVRSSDENSFDVEQFAPGVARSSARGPRFRAGFHLIPSNPNTSRIRDVLRRRDTIEAVLETTAPDGTSSSLIRPEVELGSALAHFGADRVQGLQIRFDRGKSEMNLFRQAVAAALALGKSGAQAWKEASLQTEFGRMAQALGFTEVDLPFETQVKLRSWGARGEPESLTVQFVKPSHD